MSPELLCHLPFLRVAPGVDVTFADGARLMALPFEEWLLLEDPAMGNHERRFRSVAPIFLRAALPAGETPGDLTENQDRAAAEIVERAHLAAVLALPGVAITDPALSVSYIVWRGLPVDVPNERGWFGPDQRAPASVLEDDGIQLGRIVVWLQQPVSASGTREQWLVERRFGPTQRESLFSTEARNAYIVSADDAQGFGREYIRLAAAQWGPARAAAARCADVLTAMSGAGVPLDIAVVMLVAALENLVNARADRPLGDIYARRCAAWFARDPEDRARDFGGLRQLYGARSDILHGGDPEVALQELAAAVGVTDTADLYRWLRERARWAVDSLVTWYGRHPEEDGAASLFQQTLPPMAGASAEDWGKWRAQFQEEPDHGRA